MNTALRCSAWCFLRSRKTPKPHAPWDGVCIWKVGPSAPQPRGHPRRTSMDSSEERRLQDRRRRTEQQRDKRAQERICGYCRQQAGGLIEWAGRGRPLLIPICQECLGRLTGDWHLMTGYGVRCALGEPRPCAACISRPAADRPQAGIFRRLLGR